MEAIVRSYLLGLGLGEAASFENMQVFPLFSTTNDGPQYAMLKEALEKQVVIITEIHEGGSVPQLKVVNHSEQFVLLLDGEQLMGAEQNRVINTSILLKGKSPILGPNRGDTETQRQNWTQINTDEHCNAQNSVRDSSINRDMAFTKLLACSTNGGTALGSNWKRSS